MQIPNQRSKYDETKNRSWVASRLFSNLGIIIVFMILAGVNGWLIISHHSLAIGSDMQFHWQEILELMKSSSVFPRYAMNSYLYSGSAVLTMYPYLLLYPFVWIFHSLHSVRLTLYSMFIINTFISLMIAYYSSLSVTKLHRRTTSFIFAVTYAISSVFIITTFITSDVGVLDTMIFLPLVIFGFIYWIRDNKWLMLSIGMSLIVYSNVLAAAYIPVLLVIWLIIDFQYIRISKLFSLLKAGVVAILATAMFWWPALKLWTTNQLNTPSIGFTRSNSIKFQNVSEILKNALNPTLGVKLALYDHYIITIYALLGIVVGILFYLKLSPIFKRAFLFSLVVLWMCSNYFPWIKLIKFMPAVKMLQFTGRMLVVPQVLLTFILAIGITRIISKLRSIQIPIVVMLVLVVIGIQAVAQRSAVDQPVINVNNHILNPNAGSRKMLDYYPTSAVASGNNITHHRGITWLNGRQQLIKTTPLGNGSFMIDNRFPFTIKTLEMPFLNYHHVEYQTVLNNHQIANYSSRQQLLTVKNVKPGQSTLKIQPQTSNLYLYITALGGLIYLIELVDRSLYHREY